MATKDDNNNLSELQLSSPKGRGNILREARTFVRMKSPEKEMSMSMQPATNCICFRKIMGILCSSCGNVFRGRVRQWCHFHPNSKYLMDYEVCPNCKATQLREFEEMTDMTDMDCEKERHG